MANKVEIIINADGSRAIKAMQDVGATARATGKSNAEASKATALAAKFAGDTVKAESIKAIQAITAQRVASKDYAQIQGMLRKGSLDEAVGTRAAAAAYQRLTATTLEATEANKKHLASMQKSGKEWATLREHFAGGLSLGGSMGESMLGMASIAGITAAAMALKDAVKSSLEFGEAIHRASLNTGLAAGTLSTLHYAADVTGGDFEAITKGVERMDKQIAAATSGNKTAAAVMKTLGLNAEALASSPDGAEIAFKRMAETLANTKNAIQRVDLASQMMGQRMGAEQVATLIEVGTHLDEYTASAKAAGVYMDSLSAEKLEALNAKLLDLDEQLTGAKLGFTEGFIGPMGQMIDVIEQSTGPMDSLNALGKELGRTFAALATVFYSVASGQAMVASLAEGGRLTSQGRLEWDRSKQYNDKANQSGAIAAGVSPGEPSAFDQDFADARTLDARGGKGYAGTPDPEAAEKAEAAARKAAQARLKGYEAQLAEMKTQTTVSAKAEFDYWAQRIAAFQRGSEQYDAVIAKQASLAVEGAKTAHELILKYQKESNATANLNPAEATRGIDAIRKLMGEADDNITRSGQRWRLYNEMIAKNTELVIKNAEAMRALQIERGVKMGTISKGSAAQSMSDIHASASVATIADLKQELAKLKTEETHDPVTGQNTDSKNASAQQGVLNQITVEQGKAQLQAMQDQWAVFSESALGGAVTALGEFTAASRDSAAQIKQIVDNTLNSVNSAILKDLTDKNYQRRGDWTGAGKSIFTDISGTALKKGEGSIMGMIPGLVGAKLGTQNNPMWTRSVEKLLTGTSKADMDSISSLLPQRTPGASFALPPSLFPGTGMPGAASSTGTLDAGAAALGKSLFGSNGPAMPNVTSVMNSNDQAPAALASIGMKALFASIPFMASGGDFDAGTTAMVGEQGPELVHFGSAGHVTPNHKLSMGGGDTHHTWNIDARGSNNPAQTMAMVQQGILQAAPHLIAATKKSMQSDNSRVAPSARR